MLRIDRLFQRRVIVRVSPPANIRPSFQQRNLRSIASQRDRSGKPGNTGAYNNNIAMLQATHDATRLRNIIKAPRARITIFAAVGTLTRSEKTSHPRARILTSRS